MTTEVIEMVKCKNCVMIIPSKRSPFCDECDGEFDPAEEIVSTEPDMTKEDAEKIKKAKTLLGMVPSKKKAKIRKPRKKKGALPSFAEEMGFDTTEIISEDPEPVDPSVEVVSGVDLVALITDNMLTTNEMEWIKTQANKEAVPVDVMCVAMIQYIINYTTGSDMPMLSELANKAYDDIPHLPKKAMERIQKNVKEMKFYKRGKVPMKEDSAGKLVPDVDIMSELAKL